jgi:hypothetical protein
MAAKSGTLIANGYVGEAGEGQQYYERVAVFSGTDAGIWQNVYLVEGNIFLGADFIRAVTDNDRAVYGAPLDSFTDKYTRVAGFVINPPDGLMGADLVKWYEASILGAIEFLGRAAKKLGVSSNEVGKLLTQTTSTLATITSTVYTSLSAAAVAAGTGLAGVLAVATPITAGVAAIVGLLSAMGVFDNKDAEKQQEQLGIDYNSLSFVMQKWYNGYAKAL